MSKILYILLLTAVSFSAEKRLDEGSNSTDDSYKYNSNAKELSKVGDFTPPNNPLLDRAKGYLLKGKVKAAILNYGNFITWDYHPAGLWGEYTYLPHVGMIAGAPGVRYSSDFFWEDCTEESENSDILIEEGIKVYCSYDAFDAWIDGTDKFSTIVFENKDDRAIIGEHVPLVLDDPLTLDIDESKYWCDKIDDADGVDCYGQRNVFIYNENEAVNGISTANKNGTVSDITDPQQWGINSTDRIVFLSVAPTLSNSKSPNLSASRIGLAYPWATRPALAQRKDLDTYDLYEYGKDLQEWTYDDEYDYYGYTSQESWFTYAANNWNTDWHASTQSRVLGHNLENQAGDLFGSTKLGTSFVTDEDDTYPLLAHSNYKETWPIKYNFETGNSEPVWPGWYALDYVGDSPELWADLGVSGCSGDRSDDDCWVESADKRHISDTDVYMAFDDRWAHRGNQVSDNEYLQTGYPLGLKVEAMAHSYSVSMAEDIMFVTVRVRNESGNWSDSPDCPDPEQCRGMVLPDGTLINNGRGFDYSGIYLGFYMDADVLSADILGNTGVHSNADDFMDYEDFKFEHLGDSLRVSMAMIGDFDGNSNGIRGFSMDQEAQIGTDFGIVAVQLLDSPLATEDVDLNQDGITDVFIGEPLKMTDWHWFDWYNRPGVVNAESNTNCCAGMTGRAQALNKEEINYKVMAGDTTNLTANEKSWYFHTEDPTVDDHTDPAGFNPHFDSYEGLRLEPVFLQGEEGLDCVMEMSSGPFDLAVGESVPFSFTIIFGSNKTDLINNAKFAQIVYDANYQTFKPPTTPLVYAEPFHEKAVLFWTDASVRSRDVVTGYSDFEGFKIYRSEDGGLTWGDQIKFEGNPVGWFPRAQYDLSEEDDKEHCVLGWEDTDGDGQEDACVDGLKRNYAISGIDPAAPWFDLGSNTGFENIEIENVIGHCSVASFCMDNNQNKNYNTKSACEESGQIWVDCNNKTNCEGNAGEWMSLSYCNDLGGVDELSCNALAEDCAWDSNNSVCYYSKNKLYNKYLYNLVDQGFTYAYIDSTVTDGIEYSYSVTAYDIGIRSAIEDCVPIAGSAGCDQELTYIADPLDWQKLGEFPSIENGKGTTVFDPNFVTVAPGNKPTASNYLDEIKVVPNPYIVRSNFTESRWGKIIRFTNLPSECTITIYTISGEKVFAIKHENESYGDAQWDLRTINNQEVAPGLYLYTVVTDSGEKHIGKFAIVK